MNDRQIGKSLHDAQRIVAEQQSAALNREGAAPRAEGLDPDVLIPLLHATHTSEGCVIPRHAGYHPSIAGRKSCEIRFERMVAHAARLSRPSDERVPDPRDDPSNYDVQVIEAALDADERGGEG